MGKQWSGHVMTLMDVLASCGDVEKEYGVRIRLSVVPLSRASGRATHALLVTPYTPAGKRLHEVDAQQMLWPSKTIRNENAAFMRMVHVLAGELDTWAVSRRRQEEQQAAACGPDLLSLIAASDTSQGLPLDV